MTKTSAIVGSPLYMSPEQMRSAKSVDARTDIWSLGAILYELLSGRPPFTGESLPELCVNIMNAVPTPLTSLRPDVPRKLETAILRCLEKDRQNRYANVAELAVALADFAPRQAKSSVERVAKVIQAAGISSSNFQLPEGTIPPPGSKQAKTHASWGSTTPGGPPSRAPLFAFLGIGALAVGGAGVWIGARSQDAASPPAVIAPAPTIADSSRAAPAPGTALPIPVTALSAATPPAAASASAGGVPAPAEITAATKPHAPSAAAPVPNPGRAPAPAANVARPSVGSRPSRPETRPAAAPPTSPPGPTPPGDIFQDRQ
jgi:eukaryotic-like serine/threonine-protein kinase